ncbi:hypothetical protein U1Q18_002079 [Sarracenia purpurea var. burkii]
MAGYVGILESDPRLHNQFTLVKLRSLKAPSAMVRIENRRLTLADLATEMLRLKHVEENPTGQERASIIRDSYPNLDDDVDFELFLWVSVEKIKCRYENSEGEPTFAFFPLFQIMISEIQIRWMPEEMPDLKWVEHS